MRMGGQRHAPAALSLEHPVPSVQEAVWAPGPVWTVAENLAPTGIRFLERPTRSESQYRLSYRVPINRDEIVGVFIREKESSLSQ